MLTRHATTSRMGTTPRTTTPTVSVVIPTRNEAGNVDELLRRLAEALPAGAEVVLVDDSTDDTADRARAAAPAVPFTLTVIHRDAPTGGLGGAVVAGLRAARADWAVVMDGDLQHPPAVVAELLAAAPGHDVVVATRYADDGDGSGLGSPYRHAVSRGSKALAARLLGGAVARMSDPLSGFFAVRRAALDLDAVDPIGYKILLELVVRSGPRAHRRGALHLRGAPRGGVEVDRPRGDALPAPPRGRCGARSGPSAPPPRRSASTTAATTRPARPASRSSSSPARPRRSSRASPAASTGSPSACASGGTASTCSPRSRSRA